MRFEVKKYAGGTYCGNGFFETMDECYEFANDGFCDYMRVYDTKNDITLKIHFKGGDK